MTCIIGLVDKDGKTYLAGDSMGYANVSWGTPVSNPKVFKVKDKPIVLGYTTSFRMGQLLEFHPEIFPDLHRDKTEYTREYIIREVIPRLQGLYRESGWGKKDGDGAADGGTFLIGVPGAVYTVQDNFAVLEHIHGYEACGCGCYAACASVATSCKNGVEDPKTILKAAMEVTVQYSPGVQPPFHYVTTDGEAGEL